MRDHLEPPDAGVQLSWWPARTSTIDALRALGAQQCGHLCPRCGADDHGRPWARWEGRRRAVSAARAGPHLLVLTRSRPTGASVGVDLELAGARLDPGLVCHPDDPSEDPLGVWLAKEAVLKWRGTGLRTDPTTLRLADYDVRPLPAPPGLRAVVCLGRRAVT